MAVATELRRRERRKLEVRQRIVEAAAALFEERGFAETRIAEICERADVAHKTFFNHFPSKQELLREFASLSLDELVADVASARAQGRSTGERLERFFTLAADRVAEGGPIRRELVTELVHAVHESPSVSEHARRLHDAFGAIVADGLAQGDVTRRHDAETLTEMILGAYYVLMFNFASLDAFPVRRQALAAARFLADALAPNPED